MIGKILHKIAHMLQLNCGKVETFYDDNGRLMVGFRCSVCGELGDVECIDSIVDNLLKK